jgi:hypothetical protein
MSSTRVYVPTSMAGLRALVTADGIGPAPFVAHAVTDELRAAYADGGEEEWEYAAAAAASRASLALIGEDDQPRRVVVAVDVGTVLPAEGPQAEADPTIVTVDEVVPFRRIGSVLVDLPEAEADVRAAAAAWLAAEGGDEAADQLVERALDHELAWFAAQEIGDLLGLPG